MNNQPTEEIIFKHCDKCKRTKRYSSFYRNSRHCAICNHCEESREKNILKMFEKAFEIMNLRDTVSYCLTENEESKNGST